LYTLPAVEPLIAEQASRGITIRRAIAPEKHFVVNWVITHFSAFWGSEVDVAVNHVPPTCWMATEAGSLVGFACYDTSTLGFFGPIGVSEATRGRGTGKALLVATLNAMRCVGYGYAIIGGVGPVEFYEKTVGATVIPESTPSVYAGMLRK
jgi:GNAT superfamily N-acetyltransferase